MSIGDILPLIAFLDFSEVASWSIGKTNRLVARETPEFTSSLPSSD